MLVFRVLGTGSCWVAEATQTLHPPAPPPHLLGFQTCAEVALVREEEES